MASEYHWSVTAGLVTSSVIAVTANLLLLIVFARRRGLRTVPNRFVINLLVTNLLSSVLLVPLLLVDQTDYDENQRVGGTNRVFFVEEDEEDDEEAVISDGLGDKIELIETTIVGSYLNGTINKATNQSFVLCYLAQSSTSLVCTASIFSILLIGVNQYFAVIHSLRYHFYINKCRSMALIGTSWFVSVMFSLMKAATQTDSTLWRFCHNQPKPTKFAYIFNAIYAFAYFIVVILVPFVAISIIYVCIYKAAHKNSERMRKSTSGSCNSNLDSYVQVPIKYNVKEPTTDGGTRRTLVKVHSAPNFLNLESTCVKTPVKVTRTCSERTSSNFINSIRCKITNATVFRYREETRAAKISIIVIFMVLICYIPYGTILILNSNVISVKTPKILNYVSLVLLVLSNIVSPFLFAYRNKRIQRELGKFFGLISASQNSNRVNSLRKSTITRRNSFVCKNENITEEKSEGTTNATKPFLLDNQIPQVIVTCKNETEKKSILKRVCSTKNWPNYKKCTFITVPDSCLGTDARGSFSSASTQISSED